MAAFSPLPRLRPVEVFPAKQDNRPILVVQDPSGLALGPIAVSPTALFILSLLDGEHSLEQIREMFEKETRNSLPADQLEAMIDQLDAAFYLDSPHFHAFMEAEIEAYRTAPTRLSADATTLGADGDGLSATLERLLHENERVRPRNNGGPVAGLIAPHLDYVRGQRCYADVYGLLAESEPPRRAVILGTNHFGQASSVVATGKDFETPLGTTRTDRAFLDDLQRRCRCDMTGHEFDHQREHSVELQVIMLQHIWGPASFEIVPILCPDPCGPTGTLPHDGRGVDLRVFAAELGDMVRSAGPGTIVIAGADLSHVGPRFGDDRELDDTFLQEVEHVDQRVLEALASGDPPAFLQILMGHGNATRICSVGCLYTLIAALGWAKPELLRYHQAVNRDSGTGVTCASVVLRGR